MLVPNKLATSIFGQTLRNQTALLRQNHHLALVLLCHSNLIKYLYFIEFNL